MNSLPAMNSLRAMNSLPAMNSLSVIVPALDEEARIQECLRSVLAARGSWPIELLVVDGGSKDRTVEQAAALPEVKIVPSARGRARQQNAGAAAATGDVLLFLHADCALQPGALAALEQVIAAHPRSPGGAFRMEFDGPGAALRFVEAVSHARLRLGGIACGDQAIWVRRAAFLELGGFPDQRLMEDVSFSRALSRRGGLAIVEDPPVLTSARRFSADGVLRRTVSNWAISAAWALGVNIATLKRFYPDREVPAPDPAA